MSRLVVDASAILAWIYQEPSAENVAPYMTKLAVETCFAPAVLPLELANSVYKGRLTKRFTDAQCTELCAMLSILPISLIEIWFSRVSELDAICAGQAIAAYDAAYILLAQDLGASLLTRDAGMARTARALSMPLAL